MSNLIDYLYGKTREFAGSIQVNLNALIKGKIETTSTASDSIKTPGGGQFGGDITAVGNIVKYKAGTTSIRHLQGTNSGAGEYYLYNDSNVKQVLLSGNRPNAFGQRVLVQNTTEATTTTDGSLQTDGGLSVAKNAVIGTGLAVVRSITQSGVTASTGTVDLDTTFNTGGGYQGILVVSNTITANANARTQRTYSIFGRGTTSSIQQIHSVNGTSGGAAFTITIPSNGIIRLTNNAGHETTVYMQFFGGKSK